MRLRQLLKQFNWRFLLVRILVNALALAVTAAVTPKIYFVDKTVWSWLIMALMLGVLNALLKPILQFLTLQFLFVTYGLVIVVVNTLILMLLSFLFPARFAVDNLLWALVGGLILGVLSSFLESLLGLTMPIVPDEPQEIRQQVEEQALQIDWLRTANTGALAEEQTPATVAPAQEAKAVDPAVAEISAIRPDEGPSPPAEDDQEPPDSMVPPPAETASAVGPEPAAELPEEQKEDLS